MSQHDKELFDAIDKMLDERTFSLEAVEAVKNMREDLKETKFNLDVAAKRVIALEDRQKEIHAELTKKQLELEGWEARLINLTTREHKMTKLECDVEKHKAVGDAFALCFQQAFANVTVRRTANKAMMRKGYGSDAEESPTSHPEDSVTEES